MSVWLGIKGTIEGPHFSAWKFFKEFMASQQEEEYSIDKSVLLPEVQFWVCHDGEYALELMLDFAKELKKHKHIHCDLNITVRYIQ